MPKWCGGGLAKPGRAVWSSLPPAKPIRAPRRSASSVSHSKTPQAEQISTSGIQLVVEELDQIGVPAADVRDQQHVLTASKLLVQPGNGMPVGGFVRAVGDLPVARTV